MAAKAWLVTHPETKLDQEGRVHGKLDPPLSNLGRHKAELIAMRFKDKGVTAIHSSPRQRAMYLAGKIKEKTGAPIEVHDELIPWDLGSMSGAKTAAIKALLDFFSNHPDRKVPSGESKQDVIKRYKGFMPKVKAGHVVVGHSQHSLALQHVRKGGDMAKVPMFGGKAGEIREIEL